MKKVQLEISEKLYAQLSSLCYEGRYESIEEAMIQIVKNLVESNWCFHQLGDDISHLSKEEQYDLRKFWACLHLNKDVFLVDIDTGGLPCGECGYKYCSYYDENSLARKILHERLTTNP